MAVILASGKTAANSTEIVVAAGTPVTIALSVATDDPVPSQAECDVQWKDAAGKYHTFGKLLGRDPEKSVRAIDSPGTYRVARLACTEAFAVETS